MGKSNNFFFVAYNKCMKKLKTKKDEFISRFDPNGSYTGSPIEDNEWPVQDADDL